MFYISQSTLLTYLEELDILRSTLILTFLPQKNCVDVLVSGTFIEQTNRLVRSMIEFVSLKRHIFISMIIREIYYF